MALVAIAHFALIPFILQLGLPSSAQLGVLGQAFGAALDIWLSSVLIRVSLKLGRGIGLGLLPIDGWVGSNSSTSRIQRAGIEGALSGLAVGLAVGIALAAIGDRWPMRAMGEPTLWARALASLGAGIYEEVWFRLGAMTIFAWVLMKLSARSVVTSPFVWIANLLAALLFGAAHLPQVHAVTTLTPSLITVVLVGNGIVGLLCGWLYWRRGLLVAMIAHTSVDLVLKVVFPLLTGEISLSGS